MNGMYEIKGSNTLYQVWGIITFIFTGIYGLLRLIALIVAGIGVAAADELAWGMEAYIGDYMDAAEAYIVIIILLVVFLTIAGLIIRICAGLYLVRPGVKSKGALIAVGIVYFLMALVNLAGAVIEGRGSAVLAIFYLFCMVWAIVTGVFLIVKQASVIEPGRRGTYGSQNLRGRQTHVPAPNPYPHQQQVIAGPVQQVPSPGRAEHGQEACILGMFGSYVGKKYILKPGESCRIGRDSGCDIQLLHSKVSRIHCAVKLLPDGRFEVTDYSYNGTFYENKALPNNAAAIVKAGGMLVIGNADNVFSLNLLSDIQFLS